MIGKIEIKHMAYLAIFITTLISAQDDGQVHEEVTVSLQQFQVNVLDSKNHPVEGLSMDDFRVHINGKAQTIQSVIPIQNGKTLEGDVIIPEAARRMFVLVFDTMFNTSQSLQNSKQAASIFVKEHFGENDLASVFFIKRNGVYMAHNFTNDRASLLRAINVYVDGREEHRGERRVVTNFIKASGTPPKGKREGKEDMGAMADAAIAEILRTADGMNQEAVTTNPTLDFLVNFQEFVTSLAVVEGRKNMLIFSKGLMYPGKKKLMLLSQQRQLVEQLMGSETVVFGIDTSRQGFVSRKGNLDFLNDLSFTSGGYLFTNQNRYDKVVGVVSEMTEHSYLVSVYSDVATRKGKLTRVKIKVNQPRTRVLFSKGRVLNPEDQVENELTHALRNANEIQGPILEPFPNTMDVALSTVDGKRHVKVSLKIPGPYLLDITKPGDDMVLTVKTFAVKKGSDEILAESERTIKVDPHQRKEAMEQAGLMFVSLLDLESGSSYRVASHIYNETTGQKAQPFQDIHIPEAPVK